MIAFLIAAALAFLLIELFLRRRPWAMGLSAMIAALATAVWLFSDDQSRRQQNAFSAVTVTLAADPKICVDPKLPLAATIANNADETVNRLSFDVIGRLPGRSSVAYRGTLSHDRALAPGQTLTRCYALLYHGFAHPRPQIIDATKYEWTGHVTIAGFGNAPVE